MSLWDPDNQNDGPAAGTSTKPTGDAETTDYQVGYKRPPLQSRFKPGQSGNPKGRRKGTPNHRTTVNKVMNEKVSIREGDKIRRVTKFEAVLQAQANKGMKGDARGAGMVINIMAKTGLLGAQGEPTKVDESAAKAKPANLASTLRPRPGDILFADVDDALLTDDENVELAEFAEFFDVRGMAGLSASQFERIKQLISKGRATGRADA
jgi:hypothetical protein